MFIHSISQTGQISVGPASSRGGSGTSVYALEMMASPHL